MSIRVVRLGTPRCRDEGLRIGTVRRPPRGVPKARHAADDWYDVWLPALAPSAELVKLAAAIGTDDAAWTRFVKSYCAEMARPDAARLLDFVAALSHVADLSVGCYCADERRCHRRLLRDLLAARGAKIVGEGGSPRGPKGRRRA